jgi:hypothetical protein
MEVHKGGIDHVDLGWLKALYPWSAAPENYYSEDPYQSLQFQATYHLPLKKPAIGSFPVLDFKSGLLDI